MGIWQDWQNKARKRVTDMWAKQGVHIGSWGTPEFGVTEALAKTRDPVTGGSQVFPGGTQDPVNWRPGSSYPAGTQAALAGQQQLPYQPTAGTGQTGGEGGGPPMESVPGFTGPSIDFGPAYAALEAQKAEALSGREAEVAKIGAAETKRIGEVESAQAVKEQEFTRQGEREAGKVRTAGEDIRRGFSELERNIMSRFGTGTSTGMGIISQLGGDSMRMLGKNAESLKQTMSDINWESSRAREQSRSMIDNVEEWAVSSKQEAKHAYDKSITTIATSRAVLEGQKSTMRNEAFQKYLDDVRGINQRNQAFKQKIWLQDQENQKAAATFQATANKQFVAQVISLVNSGIYSMQEGRQAIGAGGGQQLAGTQMLPGMIGAGDEDEDEKTLRELGLAR